VILLLLITLNIFFSQSPFVSIYRWLRLYEYYWLFRYLSTQCSIFNIQYLKIPVIYTCILTWWQFLKQASVGGLWYFLGERTFNISTVGIAKTLLPLGMVLRSYATFPHPNALAAFLLIAAICITPRPPLKLRGGALAGVIFAFLTIPLTLSRTGIFLELLLLIFLLVKKRFWQITLAGMACALIFLIPGSPDSLVSRLELLKSAFNTIGQSPLFGVGLGNFVTTAQAFRFQPVHNVLVLAVAELGIPLFVYLVILTLKYLLKIKNCKLKIAVIFILITAQVDHYWWTLPQMQLLLTILLAVGVQLNDGGICGIYRWWSPRQSGARSLRLRSSK
jgi:hypothetical protein